MDRVSSRLISALAALPISFLLIPYVYWRSKEAPWYRVFFKPLALISVAWAVALFVPAPVFWLPCFAVIIWQSASLRTAIDKQRPRPDLRRESWQR